MPFCRGTPLTLKALRSKDYPENPRTLGEHLKKRRRELGLLQREAAERMGIWTETYANWENGKTEPVASQFRPVVEFLGYDTTLPARTLAERLQAKRRELGVTSPKWPGTWAGEVSLVANKYVSDQYANVTEVSKSTEGAGAGAGLLAGLGMLAIPGLGPVVAAG